MSSYTKATMFAKKKWILMETFLSKTNLKKNSNGRCVLHSLVAFTLTFIMVKWFEQRGSC